MTAHAYLARAIRHIDEHNLNRPATLGLIALHDAAQTSLSSVGILSLSEIGKALLDAYGITISSTNLTRMADRLEKLSFAERQTNKEDRRSTFLAITPAGRKAIGQILNLPQPHAN